MGTNYARWIPGGMTKQWLRKKENIRDDESYIATAAGFTVRRLRLCISSEHTILDSIHYTH
jgi:hypothetical protein